MSSATCTMDHAFPWKYRTAEFNVAGHMVCPSCRTELERVWSMRTLYTRPTY